MIIFISGMKKGGNFKDYREMSLAFIRKAIAFLKKEFSVRQNQVRFALATIAVIVTGQLLPGIGIASFEVTFLLIFLLIGLMISAPYVLGRIKMSFNRYTYGLYLWLPYSVLLIFFDWVLWYFEPTNAWWVLLFCLIVAVFNVIIDDLLKDENY